MKRNGKVALIGGVLLCVLCSAWVWTVHPSSVAGNFTNEMKIPNPKPLNDHGADVWDRTGDHKNSPYFYTEDFYNAKSTDSRFIIPEFKTLQQSTWWSCGPACIMMVLEHYGKLEDWNEENLAALRTDHSEQHIGTCMDQMLDIINGVGGFDVVSTYDYQDNLDDINMAFFREQIQAGYPVLVGWNDWGGHWSVICGIGV